MLNAKWTKCLNREIIETKAKKSTKLLLAVRAVVIQFSLHIVQSDLNWNRQSDRPNNYLIQ